MWRRVLLLLVIALTARAQNEDADRLLTSVRDPLVLNATLPNITVGFKTGPNIPGTEFTIKCVLAGEGCDATPQGQSVNGYLPVKPAAVEGMVQGLEVNQAYSCFVETNIKKVLYCQEATPSSGTVRFELEFAAYANATAFGPADRAQVCANVLALQPGGRCTVLSVRDGSAIVDLEVVYDDYRSSWALTDTLTQNDTAVTAELATGLEGTVEVADVVTEPPFPSPLPPTNVVSNGAAGCTPSLTVSWVAPQKSSTITGYAVSCTSSTAPTVSKTVGATQVSVTLSVQAGKAYTCSVVSQGPSGSSQPANASPVTYRYPVSCKPGQVTDVVTAQVSGNYLQRQVTWTPPASPSLPITSYTVLCSTDFIPNGNRTTSAGASNVSAIVGSGNEGPLSQGSVYTCYVYASNVAGDGPPGSSPSFVTDTLISKLGDGVPRSALPSSSVWGPDAWYSGDTRTSAGYASVLGNFSTMPAYYPDVPTSDFTDLNDALINSSFIYFYDQDPDLYPSSDDGYMFMINGKGLGGTTKADMINWFDTTWFSGVGDHLSLADVYDDSFNVTFKAALTPVNTVLKYSIKAACTPAQDVLCSYSIVYRFQNDNASWKEYSYDKDGEFAIFWSWCFGSVSDPPTAGQFINPAGQQGSESDNQFSYATWSSTSTNQVLNDCLTQGFAFGSGFSIGALSNKQTLAVDWLTQSFYRNASTINFIDPSS